LRLSIAVSKQTPGANKMAKQIIGYRIWDKQSQVFVSTVYGKLTRATRRADKLDNEYGAYRYSVRAIYGE
jgi:hypothetical protein